MYTTAIECLRAMYYPVLHSPLCLVWGVSRRKRDPAADDLDGCPSQRCPARPSQSKGRRGAGLLKLKCMPIGACCAKLATGARPGRHSAWEKEGYRPGERARLFRGLLSILTDGLAASASRELLLMPSVELGHASPGLRGGGDSIQRRGTRPADRALLRNAFASFITEGSGALRAGCMLWLCLPEPPATRSHAHFRATRGRVMVSRLTTCLSDFNHSSWPHKLLPSSIQQD